MNNKFNLLCVHNSYIIHITSTTIYISIKNYHISSCKPSIFSSHILSMKLDQPRFCRACSIFLLTWLQFNVSSACVIFNLSSLSLRSSLSSFLSSKSRSSGSLPSNPQLWRSRWLSIRRASLACFVRDKISLFCNKEMSTV